MKNVSMNIINAKNFKSNLNRLFPKKIALIVVTAVLLSSSVTAAVVHNRLTNRNDTISTQDSKVNSTSEAIKPIANIRTDSSGNSETTDSAENSPSTTRPNASESTTNPTTPTYIAPVCTKEIIPFSDSYRTSASLGSGLIEHTGGVDGYKYNCTADSDGYTPNRTPSNPYNRIITLGTGGITSSTTPNPGIYSYDEALVKAKGVCYQLEVFTKNDPKAKQWCDANVIPIYMRYWGH